VVGAKVGEATEVVALVEEPAINATQRATIAAASSAATVIAT